MTEMLVRNPPEAAANGWAPLRARIAALGWLDGAAVVCLATILLLALVGPFLAPHDPFLRVAPPYQPPSWRFLLGTDEIGRDLLSRILLGIRLTWLPGLGIILAGATIGCIVGGIAGAVGGWVDLVLQRFTELFQVLPSSIVALALIAAIGPGVFHTMIAITLFWWPWYSRLVRTELRALAGRSHVEAARLAGVSRTRLFLRYLLPGAIPVVIVNATLDVAVVVLMLSMFSFLGLGAPAPAPELGAMTARTLENLTDFWWLPIAPAAVIFILVLSANLAGDALRRALRVL